MGFLIPGSQVQILPGVFSGLLRKKDSDKWGFTGMTIKEFLDAHFENISNRLSAEGEPLTIYVHLSESPAGPQITHFSTIAGDTYWDGAQIEPITLLSPKWSNNEEALSTIKHTEQYITSEIQRRYSAS